MDIFEASEIDENSSPLPPSRLIYCAVYPYIKDKGLIDVKSLPVLN
jgi:hypothetical protein